ncbi:MAG: DUF3106 domain-containing protein [Verrucomicrobiae bacterium]|nr:DUF3106 domain-containing protein [Verrucomicrobiae bacterium]
MNPAPAIALPRRRAALPLLVLLPLTLLAAPVATPPAVTLPSPPLPHAPSATPLPASPVGTFRQWLGMPEAERTSALASRPEPQRAFLRSRLAEYESLPPEQREERLRVTDLYWHLQQLVRRPADQRPALLDSAPEDLRPVLLQRLAWWDRLAPADRDTLLAHEDTLRTLARLRTAPQPPLPPGIPPLPEPATPAGSGPAWQRWQALSDADRHRAQAQWREFFRHPPAALDAQTLPAMTPAERRQMEDVLQRFRNLPPAQRQTCIDSFARLAGMPPAERAAFLRHAERWETLPPAERAAWRRLVTQLPPLPIQPGLPPLPPSAGHR